MDHAYRWGYVKLEYVFLKADKHYPHPEVNPEFAREVRGGAIIATGRSDYSDQINNVMGFPYVFRGTLDVLAKRVNNEMKLAVAQAIAMLVSIQLKRNSRRT